MEPFKTLALGLFSEGKIGLAQAAKLADVSPSEMMDILAANKIPRTDITADEFKDELVPFKNE